MSEPLSHARARAWLADLATAQPGAKIKGEVDLKELRDTLRELLLSIRRQGLAMAIASGAAASARKQANRYVIAKLDAWLHACWGESSQEKLSALVSRLLERAETPETGQIAYLQDMTEALAFLEWGKQLVTPLAATAPSAAETADGHATLEGDPASQGEPI